MSPPICSLRPSPPRSEFTDTILSVHPSDVLDMPVDPNEPTYCLCHQVSYGEMIGCDNPDVSVGARRGGCCRRTWGLEMGVLDTGVHCGPSGEVLCQVGVGEVVVCFWVWHTEQQSADCRLSPLLCSVPSSGFTSPVWT